MDLTRKELSTILSLFAEQVADNILARKGLIEQEIVRAEADRRYGWRNVKEWIESEEVTPAYRKGRTYLKVVELEKASRIDRFFNPETVKHEKVR